MSQINADMRLDRLRKVFSKVTESSINFSNSELMQCFSDIDKKHSNGIQNDVVNMLGKLHTDLEACFNEAVVKFKVKEYLEQQDKLDSACSTLQQQGSSSSSSATTLSNDELNETIYQELLVQEISYLNVSIEDLTKRYEELQRDTNTILVNIANQMEYLYSESDRLSTNLAQLSNINSDD